MNITEFLRRRGFNEFEGYSQQIPKQVEDLIRLTHTDPMGCIMEPRQETTHVDRMIYIMEPQQEVTHVDRTIYIMEIGFNAGHSAELFLHHHSHLHLTSFDLGAHEYVPVAKSYIDFMYPDRHHLILGDSTITVPQYILEHPGKTFDLIFVDGCHEYDVVYQDMENVRKLAHPNTIVILDDTMYTAGWEAEWTQGPSNVWINQIRKNQIQAVGHADYFPGRGMSWGKFLFKE